MKCEIGCKNGKPYKLEFDKFGNQQACDDDIFNKYAWFLTVDSDYAGNYRTKREALNAI